MNRARVPRDVPQTMWFLTEIHIDSGMLAKLVASDMLDSALILAQYVSIKSLHWLEASYARLHRRQTMRVRTLGGLNLAAVALSVGEAGAATSSTGPYSPPAYQPKLERPQAPTTYTPKV